jgi:hypothetical protein
MCIWYNWLHIYMNDIQESLCDGGAAYGKAYQTWVTFMVGGIGQALGMLMYLSSRGVVHEAAASGRRALEFLGVVSHLVKDPSKSAFLIEGCEDSNSFKQAFLSGSKRQSEELKQRGIKYRFAAMDSGLAKASTELWQIFSRYNIHGDSLRVLHNFISLSPTEYSCSFFNRSVTESAKAITLFKPILEITAIELAALVGQFGERSDRIKQAGACVLVWSNRNDPRWLEQLDEMQRNLGLISSPQLRPN